MRVGVTSENKLKVEAVREAYKRMGLSPEIIGYSTSSGVGEQPIDNQTGMGARNRLFDLLKRVKGLDMIVSIENGLFPVPSEGWVDRASVVILDISGKTYSHLSEGVVFPDRYVEIAQKIGFDKITAGEVMAAAGYVADASDPHLTLSGKSRKNYIADTAYKILKRAARENKFS